MAFQLPPDAREAVVLPNQGALRQDSKIRHDNARDKGKLDLLRNIDGKFKSVVTLYVVGKFGGVGRRAIEKAAHKGSLETEGEGPNRRVLVQSLLKYFPPENSAN